MAKTMTDKLLSKLSTGKDVTVTKIMNSVGLANPAAAIHRLREQGYNIYTNKVGGETSYRWSQTNPYTN